MAEPVRRYIAQRISDFKGLAAFVFQGRDGVISRFVVGEDRGLSLLVLNFLGSDGRLNDQDPERDNGTGAASLMRELMSLDTPDFF